MDPTPRWSAADRPPDFALRQLRAEYARDDAGNPLGRGMPLGSSLRMDGESHRMAWMRIIRADPCSFCGVTPSGTVDHIDPRSLPVHSPGGAHSWVNFTAACSRCNQGKRARSLVAFMLMRAYSRPRRKAA